MTSAETSARAWRETAEADENHEMLIHDLMDGQYSRPTRIVAFNTLRVGPAMSPWILPTSYVGGLPSTMTCRLLWSCSCNWQDAQAESDGVSSS